MANDDQLRVAQRGGARYRSVHRALLTLTAAVVGVTGYSGSITGGSGGTTDGIYTLGFTGGTLATGGSAATGVFVVTSGAVSAIYITSPGQYSSAPTAFSFSACAGLSGASATLTSAPCASMTWPLLTTPGQPGLFSGSRVSAIKAFTSTAFTGSPTNIYLQSGVYVNDNAYLAGTTTDVKAAGVFAPSFVTAGLPALRTIANQLTVAIVANGGTNVAGSTEVEVEFTAPNPGGI